MRRSAKPWYRIRNVALIFAGALLLMVGAAVLSAWNAQPGPPVDYFQKFHELTASYQPGSPADPDAWEPFLAAVAIMEGVDEEMRIGPDGEPAPPHDWPPNSNWPYDFTDARNPEAPPMAVERAERAMRMLEERGAAAHLAEMAVRPRAVRPKFEGFERAIDVLMPELGKARNLARWSSARMHAAADAGDTRAVVEAFEQMLALGRVTASQSTLIERLVGLAIFSMAAGDAKSIIINGAGDAAMCRGMLEALDRQWTIPPAEVALEGERLFVLDAIQWTHTDDGRGSGRLILTQLHRMEGGSDATHTGLLSHPMSNVVGLVLPSRRETTDRANFVYDKLVEHSRMRPADRAADGFNVDLYVESVPRGFLVLRMMLPALGRAMQQEDMHRSQMARLRLELALEVYREEHGEYPARLEDLTPGILRAVPVDPLSGRPYAYTPLAPGEGLGGWDYTLHVAGDDGGMGHVSEEAAPDGSDVGPR